MIHNFASTYAHVYMKSKNYIIMFVSLMIIWLLLNASFDSVVIITGIVISTIISVFFCKSCEVFTTVRLSPKAILYSLIYIVVFFKELLKSNFDVAYRVVSPSLPINPGIVEVKTKLKSKIGRIFLANSITLTPGTFTLEMNEDSLFIHWIEVKSDNIEEDTNILVRKFEKYLEVMYG
jgi:multicomponent Na+:H+ antiporter subunit E